MLETRYTRRKFEMDELYYPIYQIGAKWTQDGLPESLEYNSTGFSKMFKDDPGIDGARQYAMEWWEAELNKKPRQHEKTYAELNAELFSLECRFYERETWCITWFSHYTYNIHLTDKELIKSFEDFVDRKMPLHRNLEIYNDEERKKYQVKIYCLMGAEDYWRWKGPCRCEHCVKAGITRIDH